VAPLLSALPRVCVVGAGSSGIAVCKELHVRGIPFDAFESGDRVGGNWVFKNSNGRSAAYRSLHINTSRERMQFADYPMPQDYPDFPEHALIAAYFERYVDHFGFRHKIAFRTTVDHIRPLAEGGYEVRLSHGETRRYDAVAIASGHHWDPQWPEPRPPGPFGGVELHSHAYIDPDEPHALRGKRVVVVGMGNSAMDIACELSRPDTASAVFLSARRGAHVIPHYLFGRPLDTLNVLRPPIPLGVRTRVGKLIHRLAVGRMRDYGLPEPSHELHQAHPTISSEILPKLGKGDIVPKPAIVRLDGDRVVFADGSEERVDAIVWCTGYKVSFPFFDPDFVAAHQNRLPLFLRVFRPERPDLFFIGLLQPLGAIMPLAEEQAKWIADYLTGCYALPERHEMAQRTAADDEAMQRRYVASPRHTMQVDFDDYLVALRRERARGRRRARRRGFPLPLGRAQPNSRSKPHES
jgi:dimethylaniline monooxygenase (N-oxide forming)